METSPEARAADRVEVEEERRAEKAGAMVMAARMAVRRGDRDEARRHLQQALVLQPNDAAAIELVGDMYLEEAEQEKALKVFEKGLALHPANRSFEEKIGVCHLDLQEMRRDAELRRQVAEHGDTERWLDRKPGVALGLSVLVPGVGQFYNDENERGAWLLGAMVVTFCGWFLPLNLASHAAQGAGGHNFVNLAEHAVDQMAGVVKLWFWTMMLAWNGVYVVAGIDAWQGAERANLARRRALGII